MDERLKNADWANPHVRSKSYGVALIPKAASTAMHNTRLFYREGVCPVPLYAFVREPIERLGSAWRFFRDKQADELVPRHYEVFVDRILDADHFNAHWCPQALLVEDHPQVIPVRFEDMARVWRQVGFPLLKHQNWSNPRRRFDSTYRAKELVDYYAADHALRDAEWQRMAM